MASLSDRMTGYAEVSQGRLMCKTPVIIRVDGRAFHTFTRGMRKPFDQTLMDAMDSAAMTTSEEMQGFKMGYVQSDEASFLLSDLDRPEAMGWFGYNHSKIVSLSAAMFSANFVEEMRRRDIKRLNHHSPIFDARAFNVPIDEVSNYFLWRARDWARNSLQMLARVHYSQKQLHGKQRHDLHELLHEKNINWTLDTTPRERNGLLFFGCGNTANPQPRFAEIDTIVSAAMMPGRETQHNAPIRT